MNSNRKLTFLLAAILSLFTVSRAGAPPIGRAYRPPVRPIETYRPSYERPGAIGEGRYDPANPYGRDPIDPLGTGRGEPGGYRERSFEIETEHRLKSLREVWGKEQLETYSRTEQIAI